MKYTNFNIYIFSTIKKYVNIIISNFIKLSKKVDIKKYYLRFKKNNINSPIKLLNFRYYNLSRLYKYLSLQNYNLYKFFKYLSLRNFNLNKIYKYINLKKKKEISIYIILPIIFFGIIYLGVPKFYKYEQEKIEKIACKGINIKCSIKGKIKYSFIPSPRVIISELNFTDKSKENIIYGKVNKLTIHISFKNLLDKEKLNYKEVKIANSVLNINIGKLKNTKDYFLNNFISKSLVISDSKINFFDGNNFLTDITNVKYFFKTNQKKDTSTLKGNFLNDNIVIKYKKNTKDKKIHKKFVVNFSDFNLFAKVELINDPSVKNNTVGNMLVKKDKNVLSGLINYKNEKLFLKNTNISNAFLDGKIDGYLKFDPFFDFNLAVNLNSANFNKVFNNLIKLDDKSKKDLFKFNKKINGKIDLSINKIFSKNTFINSLESRINLLNGNIFFDQALFNLGKLGAADFTGNINNENKFSIFSFENNVFIDNKKKFFNKFGVYNKKKVPFNFFTSGSFDLTNLIFRINEVTTDEKIAEEDVGAIQETFNAILLENGYETLFSFQSLKDFVKSISSD